MIRLLLWILAAMTTTIVASNLAQNYVDSIESSEKFIRIESIVNYEPYSTEEKLERIGNLAENEDAKANFEAAHDDILQKLKNGLAKVLVDFIELKYIDDVQNEKELTIKERDLLTNYRLAIIDLNDALHALLQEVDQEQIVELVNPLAITKEQSECQSKTTKTTFGTTTTSAMTTTTEATTTKSPTKPPFPGLPGGTRPIFGGAGPAATTTEKPTTKLIKRIDPGNGEAYTKSDAELAMG